MLSKIFESIREFRIRICRAITKTDVRQNIIAKIVANGNHSSVHYKILHSGDLSLFAEFGGEPIIVENPPIIIMREPQRRPNILLANTMFYVIEYCRKT